MEDIPVVILINGDASVNMGKEPLKQFKTKCLHAQCYSNVWSIHHRGLMHVAVNCCRSGMVGYPDDTFLSYTTATDLGIITIIALLFILFGGACTVPRYPRYLRVSHQLFPGCRTCPSHECGNSSALWGACTPCCHHGAADCSNTEALTVQPSIAITLGLRECASHVADTSRPEVAGRSHRATTPYM